MVGLRKIYLVPILTLLYILFYRMTSISNRNIAISSGRWEAFFVGHAPDDQWRQYDLIILPQMAGACPTNQEAMQGEKEFHFDLRGRLLLMIN